MATKAMRTATAEMVCEECGEACDAVTAVGDLDLCGPCEARLVEEQRAADAGTVPDGYEATWIESSAEIARLLEWLAEVDPDWAVADMAAVCGVLRKPWHWDSEYRAMLRGSKVPT